MINPTRLVGGVVLAAGLVVIALSIPHVGARPLFDGVVVTEPYRYLHPGPGQHGNPLSFSQEFDIVGGQSPILSAGTGESPPQASVYANQGDLQVGPSATSIEIDIQPVEPPAEPDNGSLAGNVYQISVTDTTGAAILPTPGGGFSVVLRQPEDVSGKAMMALFMDGHWYDVPSSDAGSRGFYVATPVELGVFGLIVGARNLPTLPPVSIETFGATAAGTALTSEESLIARLPPSQAPVATASVAQAPVPPPTPVPTAQPAPQANSTSLGAASLIIILAIAVIIGAFALPRLRRRT